MMAAATGSSPASSPGRSSSGSVPGPGTPSPWSVRAKTAAARPSPSKRSAVSADQWSAIDVPVPAGTDQVAAMTVHGRDLWFSLTTSASQANQLLVSGTASGAHFSTGPSPCFSGLGGSIEASSADVLWAMCPTGMMAEAFRSTDGGSQWEPLSAGELEELGPADAGQRHDRLDPAGPARRAVEDRRRGRHLALHRPRRCQRVVVVVDRFHRRSDRLGAGTGRCPGQLALAARPLPGAAVAHGRRRCHLVRTGEDRRLTGPVKGRTRPPGAEDPCPNICSAGTLVSLCRTGSSSGELGSTTFVTCPSTCPGTG